MTAVAGSIEIGPYARSEASCKPCSGVQVTETMWSVKYLPKPGLARISARCASGTGAGFGVTLNSRLPTVVMGVTLVGLWSWVIAYGLLRPTGSSRG